jgi:hypothetical protein
MLPGILHQCLRHLFAGMRELAEYPAGAAGPGFGVDGTQKGDGVGFIDLAGQGGD